MLTAFYLLPALKMEDLVWRDEMRVGEFSYQTAFLTLDKAVGGLRLQAISLITILVVAACCFFAARTVKNAVSADENAPQFQVLWKRIRVWFALAVFAAFMTTPFSAPLYALILPLQRIQFPYRWLVVVSFALSPLVAATLELCTMLRAQSRNEYSMRKKWSLRIAAAAASLMVLSWIPLQAFYIRKAYPQFLPNADFARYVQWYVENGAEMPEHRSRDAQTLKTDASALYRSLGLQSRGYNFAEIVRGQGSVRVVERSPRRIELEISSLDAQNLSVRVRQFNFGAWRAVSNSNVLPISSSVPDGLVLIEVPANTSRVTLEMPPTSSEKWGKNLSLAALTMWMILLSSTWIQRRKP